MGIQGSPPWRRSVCRPGTVRLRLVGVHPASERLGSQAALRRRRCGAADRGALGCWDGARCCGPYLGGLQARLDRGGGGGGGGGSSWLMSSTLHLSMLFPIGSNPQRPAPTGVAIGSPSSLAFPSWRKSKHMPPGASTGIFGLRGSKWGGPFQDGQAGRPHASSEAIRAHPGVPVNKRRLGAASQFAGFQRMETITYGPSWDTARLGEPPPTSRRLPLGLPQVTSEQSSLRPNLKRFGLGGIDDLPPIPAIDGNFSEVPRHLGLQGRGPAYAAKPANNYSCILRAPKRPANAPPAPSRAPE